jgi:L-seryl-tRNA(Ser) seleniumtransferase
MAQTLRTGTPGLFGRIEHDRLLLDLRTVLPEQDDLLFRALLSAFSRGDSLQESQSCANRGSRD